VVLTTGAVDLLKSLLRKDQALRFRFSTDPRLYRWSL
jgi:D-amino-acid dehydrogenase